MLLGSRLKEARKKAGLTQSELGNLIGVGKSAICSYEKETRNPTIDTIFELIYALGVSADYLLGTDNIIKTDVVDKQRYRTMTKEEVMFIEILRKDKIVYEMLFQDPKRGSELIKQKLVELGAMKELKNSCRTELISFKKVSL